MKIYSGNLSKMDGPHNSNDMYCKTKLINMLFLVSKSFLKNTYALPSIYPHAIIEKNNTKKCFIRIICLLTDYILRGFVNF